MTEPAMPEPWYLAFIRGGAAIPKAIAKLIDTAGDQAGFFLEPIHIRRRGQAENDVRIADAKSDVEIATALIHGRLAIRNIEDRAAERTRQKESRRQKNLESVVRQAAEHIPESVSDAPVDPDWTAQFFEACQDVSNAEMQSIWGQILAGEVASPGPVSSFVSGERETSFAKVLG
jgi:predicted RNA-binding Zn ribbon-like protein